MLPKGTDLSRMHISHRLFDNVRKLFHSKSANPVLFLPESSVDCVSLKSFVPWSSVVFLQQDFPGVL